MVTNRFNYPGEAEQLMAALGNVNWILSQVRDHGIGFF
jgi:hypothetical protein